MVQVPIPIPISVLVSHINGIENLSLGLVLQKIIIKLILILELFQKSDLILV
jgi:hypothetical protein